MTKQKDFNEIEKIGKRYRIYSSMNCKIGTLEMNFKELMENIKLLNQRLNKLELKNPIKNENK